MKPHNGSNADLKALNVRCDQALIYARASGARAANFQGRHIKKIEIEVWYAEKKAVHEREI